MDISNIFFDLHFFIYLKPLVHINISQPLPLFLLLQEPSMITKLIEEIFEVNTNEDIDDMDLCDFIKDNHQLLQPPSKPTSHTLS